jgi:hypothetical protein
MSIAELKGKLSPESAHDRMEDLLTSDAFGTMYYVGWHEGFRNWFYDAQSLGEGIPSMQQFLGGSLVRRVFFAFWPELPNGREPDVALLFLCDDGTARVLIVEAKYESGMSDFEIKGQVEVHQDLTGSQLVDQMVGFARAPDRWALVKKWFGDYTESLPPSLDFAHLLVTTHRTLPREIYREALERVPVGANTFPCPAFWLSWASLGRNLEPYSRAPQDSVVGRLIADLVALLERKEISHKPFEGFRDLQWTGAVPLGGFWRRRAFFGASDYLQVASWDKDTEAVRRPRSDCTFCIFWHPVSFFNETDYAGLTPIEDTKNLAKLFRRGAHD